MIIYNDRSCQFFFLAIAIPRQRSQVPLQDLNTGEVFFASVYVLSHQKEIQSTEMSIELTEEDWLSKELNIEDIDFGLGKGRVEIRVFNGTMEELDVHFTPDSRKHDSMVIDEESLQFLKEQNMSESELIRKETKPMELNEADKFALEEAVKLRTKQEWLKEFNDNKEKFRWFLEKYFGFKLIPELEELAESGNTKLLFNKLNEIWFELPDNQFNIQNEFAMKNGWSEFLSLIEFYSQEEAKQILN